MYSIINLVLLLLKLWSFCIIAVAVMSWLLAFGIINAHSQVVRAIHAMLFKLTEPLLRPIRRLIPSIAGMDFSPIIALIAIWFISQLVREYAFALL